MKMTLEYECCYCKSVFPAKEAIDAYDQGYKKGFLCPNCGNNIVAGLLAGQKYRPSDRKWLLLAGILFLPVVFTRHSEVVLTVFGHEFALDTVLFALWLAFLCILLIFRPSLLVNRTFLTTPVSKKR